MFRGAYFSRPAPRLILEMALGAVSMQIVGALGCANRLPAAPVVALEPSIAATDATPTLRLPADVRPLGYALDLDADPAATVVAGRVVIRVAVQTPRTTIWLHGQGLTVTQAKADFQGRNIAAIYTQTNPEGLSKLVLASAVGPGEVNLALDFTVPFGLHNDGFYKVASGGETYAMTQFEALSARSSFPCFDEPAFKAPLTLSLTTPAQLVAVANTAVDTAEALSGAGPKRTRWHFRTTVPLPTYLYAWAVGPFDVVSAPAVPPSPWRARSLPLRGLAPKGRGLELAQSLALAPDLVRRLEDYFEMGFPFDKLDLLAAPDFEAGAMENAGLIVFSDILLLVDEHQAPLRLRQLWVASMLHELAHQWFGDLVTLDWWDDLWLNESLAEWMTFAIAGQVRPQDRYEQMRADEVDGAMREDSLAAARRVHQPIRATGDVQNAFDPVTYGKGAAVIGMFERYLGPPIFRRGIHEYLVAHANGNARADDFLAALSRVSERDIATPLETFIDQPGVPLVRARLDCPAGGTPTLLLEQSRFRPVGSKVDASATWQIPICVRHGEATSFETTCTLMTERTARLELGTPHAGTAARSRASAACPAVVFPNADGRGYFLWSLPGPELRKLATANGLTDAERLSFSQSLDAGYRAGTIPAGDVLAALTDLVRDPDPTVSAPLIAILYDAKDHLLAPADRPAVMRKAAEIYDPVLATVGLLSDSRNEDVRRTERRSSAVYALEMIDTVGEPPALRRRLAALGEAYLEGGEAGDRKTRAEGLEPSLGRIALSAALAIHPENFEPWVERLPREKNLLMRDQLLTALCRDTELAHARRMRELALEPVSAESRLRVSERARPLIGQMRDARTRPAAWAWLETHLDALAAILAVEVRASLPELGAAFCSDQDAMRVEALFRPRLATLDGSARTLAKTLEKIHNCAALVAAQRASARLFFVPSAPSAAEISAPLGAKK